MLRGTILVIGGACLAAGLVLWVLAVPPAFILLAWGLLILGGTLYERIHYKRLESRPGPGWQATPERFVDDATGRTVTVYENGAGERKYVAD